VTPIEPASDAREKRYSRPTPDSVAATYAADAAEAARHGWVADSQRWEGQTLVVTYRGRLAPPAPPDASPAHAPERPRQRWVVPAVVVVVLMVAAAFKLRPVATHPRSFVPADVVLDPAHGRATRLAREARDRLGRGDVELPGVDLARYDALWEVPA
jgi:hypothetical protein